jgi:XTP/dITP diphosphohydrolase
MTNSLPIRDLVIATSNLGKIHEFGSLLPRDFRLFSLRDLDLAPPDETGSTFEDNAALKAIEISLYTNRLVLADDSGLEVDALGGSPGVYSARYAGEPPDELRNIELLLSRLDSVPDDKRSARFRCVVVVARHGKQLLTSSGKCEGTIGREPRGTNGFGYDPVFMLPDGRAMAQLTAVEKNRISHRANAFRAVAGQLTRLIDELEIIGESKSCSI